MLTLLKFHLYDYANMLLLLLMLKLEKGFVGKIID